MNTEEPSEFNTTPLHVNKAFASIVKAWLVVSGSSPAKHVCHRRTVRFGSASSWSIAVADRTGLGHYVCHELASPVTATPELSTRRAEDFNAWRISGRSWIDWLANCEYRWGRTQLQKLR